MRAAMVLLLLLVVAAMSMSMADDARAEKGKKLLRHIVLYKFKDGLPQAKIDEVVAAFAGLPKKIDGIVGFEAGVNVSGEGKSEGLTHAFVVTFRDQASLNAYLVHPAHKAYVEIVKDRREKAVVFDYWVDE